VLRGGASLRNDCWDGKRAGPHLALLIAFLGLIVACTPSDSGCSVLAKPSTATDAQNWVRTHIYEGAARLIRIEDQNHVAIRKIGYLKGRVDSLTDELGTTVSQHISHDSCRYAPRGGKDGRESCESGDREVRGIRDD
jgi:hypothetical protein